jgi:hypothetical protein
MKGGRRRRAAGGGNCLTFTVNAGRASRSNGEAGSTHGSAEKDTGDPLSTENIKRLALLQSPGPEPPAPQCRT